MVADFPTALAGQRLGGRVERLALLVRMAVDEVEDAVRARPGAVDEVGPGHRALRRNAGAQVAEPAGGSQLCKVGQLAGLHHAADSRGSMPSMPMTMTFLPALRETRFTAAEPIRAGCQSGHASRGRRGRFQKRASVDFRFFDAAEPSCRLRCNCGRNARLPASRHRPPPAACRPCSRASASRTCPAPSGRCPAAAGSAVSIGRLQNSTPGTTDGSTQWSPLQALVLS